MDIVAYIYKNYTYIINFFTSRFNIDVKEANNIVEVLLKCIARDGFYASVTLEDVLDIFKDESINEIQNFFAESGVTREQMVEVIVQIPEILFYINKLDNAYVIFKDEEFVGYLLRNGEKYQAYRLISSKKKDHSKEETSEEELIYQWRIDNIPEQIHVIDNHSYSKMIKKIIDQLKSRPDLRKEYGISETATISEIFEALTKRYKTDDLYLKTVSRKK